MNILNLLILLLILSFIPGLGFIRKLPFKIFKWAWKRIREKGKEKKKENKKREEERKREKRAKERHQELMSALSKDKAAVDQSNEETDDRENLRKEPDDDTNNDNEDGEKDQKPANKQQMLSPVKIIFSVIVIIIIIIILLKIFLGDSGREENTSPQIQQEETQSQSSTPAVVDENPTTNQPSQFSVSEKFPTSGEGYVTAQNGLKMYLDPRLTHTRPSGRVKYTLSSDPSIWIIEDKDGIDVNKMMSMPPGNYIVTSSEGSKEVYFKWWQ
ncbi:MAG: hypothetical protein WCS86_03310 [Candidatus Paceibacterota bacterium]